MTEEQFAILQRIYHGEHDIEDRSSRDEDLVIESCIQNRWIRVTPACNLDVSRRGVTAMHEYSEARKQQADQDAKAKAERRKSNLFGFLKFLLDAGIGFFLK